MESEIFNLYRADSLQVVFEAATGEKLTGDVAPELLPEAQSSHASSHTKSTSLSSSLHRKNSLRPKFKAWSFHDSIEIDFHSDEDETGLISPALAADTLTKKFKERLGERPLYVRSVAIVFESSALPDPPFRGLVSIPVKGYVQTKQVRIQKLLTWIPSASWKRAAGGLKCNAEFKEDMRKTVDAAGIWIKLDIFSPLRVAARTAGQPTKLSRLQDASEAAPAEKIPRDGEPELASGPKFNLLPTVQSIDIDTSSNKNSTSLSSSLPIKKPLKFKVWSFHDTVEIDIRSDEDEDGLCKTDTLTKKFQERLGEQPLYVRSVAIMFESSALPDPPFRGLISIPVKGYVQTKWAVCVQKLLTWIPFASWKHVLGGLSHNAEFHEEITKAKVETETLTMLPIFGQLLHRKARREGDKAVYKVNCPRCCLPVLSLWLVT